MRTPRSGCGSSANGSRGEASMPALMTGPAKKGENPVWVWRGRGGAGFASRPAWSRQFGPWLSVTARDRRADGTAGRYSRLVKAGRARLDSVGILHHMRSRSDRLGSRGERRLAIDEGG